jgi:hypothetical protein
MQMMVAVVALAAGVAACSGQPAPSEAQAAGAVADQAPAEAALPERQMGQPPANAAPAAGAPVSGLPYAQGQSFATLDEYLAFLRKRSAYDVPYWEEVSPGVYRAVAGRAGPQAQTYTRAELERRFGFRP